MTLVTGSNGFIGKSLIEAKSDAEFLGLEHCSCFCKRKNSWGVDLSKKDQTKELIADLRKLRVKNICHLAGVTPFKNSESKLNYGVDLKIAESIVNICRDCEINNLLYTSGWVVYDPKTRPPFDERVSLCPQTEYGVSKLTVEKYFKKNLQETKFINLRLSTVYGPGQTSYGLIPNLIRQALSIGKIQIQGVRTRRDYLYIKDLIKIFKLLDGHDWRRSCDLNVGSGKSYSVLEVATLVRDIILHEYHELTKLIVGTVVKESVPLNNVLDITRLTNLFGVIKFTNLKSGVLEVIKWERKRK